MAGRMRRFLWLLLLALGLGTKRHWHILFAIVSGAMLGLWLSDPQYAMLHTLFDYIGKFFMRLITMLIIPLVISSLVIGVTSVGDGQSLGRLSGRVMGWFVVLMVAGAGLGLALGLFAHPGDNLQLALQTPGSPLAALASVAPAPLQGQVLNPPSIGQLFLNLVPTNFFHSLDNLELVPVVLFTLLFSAALTSIGDAGRSLVQLFEAVFATTMKLTDWVLVLAVPGIFSITFVTVAKAGPELFSLLAPYAMIMLAGLLIQAFILYPILLKIRANIDFLTFYRAISEAIMVAFGTASSSASLPVTIACCERRAGISSRIASFVLPTGASLNKAGTTLFEVVGVMFLVQAFGLKLSALSLMMVGGLSILASIGAPGVPSAGLITMAVVINSMGVGYQSLLGAIALLWPIDRILDMCRTCVNVLSSCTVAALVAASEGELNRDVLNNRAAWQEVL
jgi:proton glutamate symport protein